MFVSPRAFSKQSELAIGWVVAAFFLAVAPPVEAKLFGVNGFSGNPGINGGKNCNHCHSDGVEPTVLLDGPAVSNVSETHTYLLRIDGGQESICGLNVSATGGTLSALASEPETRTRNDEIVNFTPKLVDGEGGCTYAFDWTAPSHGGVFRLFGSGNSANRDGQLTGDRAASTGIEVVVTGAPPVNQTPVAFSTGPYRVLVGETTPFDATPSLDWDGFIRSYAWAFGDGNEGNGAMPPHSYTSPGVYDVELTVEDDAGAIDSHATQVEVLAERLSTRAIRIASGLRRPTYLTAPEGDSRLFVVEQRGRIRVIEDGQLLQQPFLDISSTTHCCGEAGFFGLAFSKNFAETGAFYVNHVAKDGGNGTITLLRYRVSATDPNRADPATRTVLLEIGPHPHHNHYGGQIAFSSDGTLFMTVGDGGTFQGNQNSQDRGVFYGKLLRIGVDDELDGYTIPENNPFVDDPNALDEIWAYGLRNSYRFSFDRLTGDLYIGDVGENDIEEVDVEASGAAGGGNFGWRIMEGSSCVSGAAECFDGSLTLPIHEYSHDGGRCSITGGYVHRGSVPGLLGRYLFGDFCSGEIWGLRWDESLGLIDVLNLTDDLHPDSGELGQIVGFGEDGLGELYIIDYDGEIFRVARAAPDCSAGPDSDGDGVVDSCDNCVNTFNPRLGDPAFPASAPPQQDFQTSTGGQLDDDADGYGNPCDLKFTDGALVSGTDVVEMFASFNKARSGTNCGATQDRNCAPFDLDNQGNFIGASDIVRGMQLFNFAPGPKCLDCPRDCVGRSCPTN